MRRVWFRNVIEGLCLRGLRQELTLEHRAGLAERGIDLTRLEKEYPAEVFEAGLRWVGPLLVPAGTWHEQSWALGQRAVTGYFDTLLGHALSTGLRMVGPTPSLRRIGNTYRSVTNYLDVVVLEQGERTARVRIDHAAELGVFVVATMHASAQMFSGATARAEHDGFEGTSSFARLSW